jgi:hypothetical protein
MTPALVDDRRPVGRYLTSAEAAALLAYTPERYADPLAAFRAFVRRNGVPCRWRGARLLFRRADLEAFLDRRPS